MAIIQKQINFGSIYGILCTFVKQSDCFEVYYINSAVENDFLYLKYT